MIVQTNHLAKDLVTKGYLDISLIVKGFLLPYAYEIIIKKKPRRGGSVGTGMLQRGELERELKELEKDKQEVDHIKVYVKWDKKVNRKKRVYVELIEKKVRAELIGIIDENTKIKVELEEIKEEEPVINVKLIEEK